jgi:LSD1 subclass zinc finger protein
LSLLRTAPAVPAPAPHSHLVCGGCQTLLMYPQGAANVRCSRCQHITPAPPTAGTETAQLVCNGCRVLLSYPRGAESVQCSMCHTVTQVGCTRVGQTSVGPQLAGSYLCHDAFRISHAIFTPCTQVPVYGHLVCSGCSIMLMYPVGAQSVKCSVCHVVTPAASPPNAAGPSGTAAGSGGPGAAANAAGGGASRSPAPKPNQTVVVENPPTLDEQGNEVRSCTLAAHILRVSLQLGQLCNMTNASHQQ